jgi:hypothetical protein
MLGEIFLQRDVGVQGRTKLLFEVLDPRRVILQNIRVSRAYVAFEVGNFVLKLLDCIIGFLLLL